EIVGFDEGQKTGDDRLYRARRRPQAQRDLRELPALAELGYDRVGLSAVGVGVEDAAVLVREHFRGGEKALLREQRRHQAGERAARLVELDGRRAPVRDRAAPLPAGPPHRAPLPPAAPPAHPP